MQLENQKITMSANVIDTPEGIAAFRLLVIRRGLRMELRGMRLTRRGPSCAVHARNVLKDAGEKAPRSKVELLEAFEAYLHRIGVLQPIANPMQGGRLG